VLRCSSLQQDKMKKTRKNKKIKIKKGGRKLKTNHLLLHQQHSCRMKGGKIKCWNKKGSAAEAHATTDDN